MPIIDDALMARKYDEFNRQYFAGLLPKHKVLLKDAKVEGGKVPEGMLNPIKHGEFYPEIGEIWINARLYGGRDYQTFKDSFDADFKHEMVHAELLRQGKPWKHDTPEHTEAFNELARRVGAATVNVIR
jgi:hypothetical protein